MWIDSNEVEEAIETLTELMDAGLFPKSDVISAIPMPEADEPTQAAREAKAKAETAKLTEGMDREDA